MAGETVVTVIGNTTAPAELRFVGSGAGVANFTVATNVRKFNKETNEWENGESTFYRVNAWRDLAENVAETLTDKGMPVVVTGRLSNRRYEKDGVEKYSLEIEADAIGPNLARATAVVTKKSSNSQGGGGQPQQARGGQQGGGWSGSGGQSPANAWGAPQGQQQPANNGWGGQQ